MDARGSRETFTCRKAFIKRNAPPMNVEIEIQDLKQLLAELILSQKETDVKFKETDRAETMAENKGLFVIRATGDSAAIVNREEFVPKAF
jgi:hypothetical protein